MFMNFLKRTFPDFTLPAFKLPDIRLSNLDEVERACARLFTSTDGRLVLDYLKSTALMKYISADASEAQLRHAEGQRAIVLQLIRMMNAGR